MNVLAYRQIEVILTFGENLKRARKNKNLTLESLAEIYNKRFSSGMSKGTLSKYENEKQEPMISVVNNLASILNVSVDFLLKGEPDSKEDLSDINDLEKIGAVPYHPAKRIPILGRISAGLPLYTAEHLE